MVNNLTIKFRCLQRYWLNNAVITGIGIIATISDCYRSYNQFRCDLRELGPPR